MSRGRHRVYLGMAVGVGKTYRMLADAQGEAREGRDVAIGFMEPHGRAETAAQAEGLEVVPRLVVTRGTARIEEMDLAAVLKRRPQLCLIDELAHSNPPGLAHAQRYEDAEDVLAAGIDVFSTVNVQHLRSVTEQVAQITGVTVTETMPDAVLDRADEIELVDLTPEELIRRIEEGKVFPASHVPRALGGFFSRRNLDALRELALLQVVEEIEAREER